jgi:hypothetical protein
MRTQLLCTFTDTTHLEDTVDTVVKAYDIIYSKIFILFDTNDENELMCTYNIDPGNSYAEIKATISLHRKKQTNTLYTINALNAAIMANNDGKLDKNYMLDWSAYKNCILLTNDQGIRQIDTKIKKIINTK